MRKWNSLPITEKLAKTPDQSKAQVFEEFTSQLMQLQRELDAPYHTDRYFRVQLLMEVEVPRITKILRYVIQRTSKHAVNRVINHLGEKRG